MELLPEKIEGIPTEKKLSKERREIVRKEYIRLIESLQKRCGKKAVYNNFLRTDVFIIMRESEKPKSNGKQKEFGYVNMATLYHQFRSAEHDYLNFTVKLVLGVKNDKRHIQYSVNKIEVI